MCPSFRASGDEKDVTRGRARVLQELANGRRSGDWRDPAVHESLDLCLSCKACASDCPAGVDMARYKSEVLHRAYRRRLRPITHYTLGWLPRWLRAAGWAPGAGAPTVNRVAAGHADGACRRPGSTAASRRARARADLVPPAVASRARSSRRWSPGGTGGAVGRLVHQPARPGRRDAAVDVLRAAGLPGGRARRRRLLRPDLDHHRPAHRRPPPAGPAARRAGTDARQGVPIVGLEPSCTAVLRDDLLDLLPDDPRARRGSRRRRGRSPRP